MLHLPAALSTLMLTSKQVARNLHDCLAFASFKARNGWEDRTLRTLEPEISEHIKRKRPQLEDDELSQVPTVLADEQLPRGSFLSNSTSRSFNSHGSSFKRPSRSHAGSRKRVRSNSTAGQEKFASAMTWKQDHQLPQSSPPLGSASTFESASLSHPGHDDSPMFDVHPSEDEDHDLPMHNFAQEPPSSIISSSPPRTPPPTRRQLTNPKQAGADLLLYLANSPSRSPAVRINGLSSTSKEPPSTPPSQHTHLPSSVMHTPGNNLGLFNGALQTPGQNFNLADFCNVTPSPGPAHWGNHTPALSKTPGFARRGLNFDTIMPPSPTMQRKPALSQGIALELGAELVPRS